jgi:hypothetical protein
MTLATIALQRARVVTADRYQRSPPAGVSTYLPAANAQRPAADASGQASCAIGRQEGGLALVRQGAHPILDLAAGTLG